MEPFVGEIRLLAGTFAPRGWAFCEGQSLSIPQYQALFNIIGTSYGGDGRKNFQLPKLPPLKAEGGQASLRYMIAINGVYPSR